MVMENVSNKLSFPQRNWFLLCVIVAILSPVVVSSLNIGARKVSAQQAIDNNKIKDSSYKIPNTPSTSAPVKAAPDSAAH